MTDSDKAKKEMDLEIALSHVDGDIQFLAELAELFLQDYPRLVEEMRRAILQNNHSELERAAHTLKGRLAFFGLNAMRDRLFTLETMGRERDSASTKQVLAEIESAMGRILPEFTILVREQGR
ncbi:MAG TPA: Hpt domain-containing protein [Acidobacteriota bacterium]|nr:Hpt domain-containing protein [Acidobacteriota bacterium]